MSERLVFALDLVADSDLIEAYEQRHAPGAVWPEIVRDIRQRGIVEMEIWRVADRLVMIAQVVDGYPRRADPALEDSVTRWETEMDRFQKPIFEQGPKWAAMRRIFDLADQCD